jgi:hypothetical protein
MTTVDEQIVCSADAISANIDALCHDRALLSQNILSQLRNLVEGIAVRLHTDQGNAVFHYNLVAPGLAYVASEARLSFLKRFHKLLLISVSHYTMGGDPSERLMLKYYDYLCQIRQLANTQLNLNILGNLEKFPVDLDPSLREYYGKIAERIVGEGKSPSPRTTPPRYYIHTVRPFFSKGRVYYEVSFYHALSGISKFNRIIGFTHLELSEKHAVNLTLEQDAIEVLGQRMPITIITNWGVSIRPSEFENLARVFDQPISVDPNSPEYLRLMGFLTSTCSSLLALVEMTNDRYQQVKISCTQASRQPKLFPLLDRARQIVQGNGPGSNVVRYLMLRMNHQIITRQLAAGSCNKLSNLRLMYGCIPFDEMPFCTSLLEHNPQLNDLAESLDLTDRKPELLARRVQRNVEEHGKLYTPVAELEDLGDVGQLLNQHNEILYHTHCHRHLIRDCGHVFIRGYEDGTVSIIEKLQALADSGVEGYKSAVTEWLPQACPAPDDPVKLKLSSNFLRTQRSP